MRMIAAKMLEHGCCTEDDSRGGNRSLSTLHWHQRIYIKDELIRKPIDALTPPQKKYHMYCSDKNPGAFKLMKELAERCDFILKQERATGRQRTGSLDDQSVVRLRRSFRPSLSSRPSPVKQTLQTRISKALQKTSKLNAMAPNGKLHLATSSINLCKSDQMLLYLTSQTWTRGPDSEALGTEVMAALDSNVHVLLVHEMTGMEETERSGCEFSTFFACKDGATPAVLLKRGIYGEIAVPMKGGEWRKASMRLLAKSVALSADGVANAREGRDVLNLGDAGAPQQTRLKERGNSAKSVRSHPKQSVAQSDDSQQDDSAIVTRRSASRSASRSARDVLKRMSLLRSPGSPVQVAPKSAAPPKDPTKRSGQSLASSSCASIHVPSERAAAPSAEMSSAVHTLMERVVAERPDLHCVSFTEAEQMLREMDGHVGKALNRLSHKYESSKVVQDENSMYMLSASTVPPSSAPSQEAASTAAPHVDLAAPPAGKAPGGAEPTVPTSSAPSPETSLRR